jgi:hypothetical protein
MPDRPAAMRTNGRLPDPVFDEDECFYCRIDPARIQPDGMVDPAHVRCPNLSSNRSKYSEPHYVLYPLVRFRGFSVFSFRLQDSPNQISSDNPGGGTPTVYDVRTIHDPLSEPPEEDNYGHCETRIFRSGSDAPMPENKISKGAIKVFKVKMSGALRPVEASRILRLEPGDAAAV